MLCAHCDKDFVSTSSYKNHVRRCPKNPDKINEVLSPVGREKLRKMAKEHNEKQWSDVAFRAQHKESMARAVKNNPESYTSSNRGRTKQIEIDGIKLQGRWEVAFYTWAKEQGLNPQRSTESFAYTWQGERWYHPDFYLPTLDLYVEVKGYETDRDRAKWLHFPKKLAIIRAKEIEEIRKGNFSGPLIQRLE